MRIAILTGGGDAPGLNATIRAIVRRAEEYGWEVIGIRWGWKGMLEGEYINLEYDEVEEIIREGGTILGTSRVNPLKRERGLEKIKENFKKLKIDALIAIGGNDTLSVAKELYKMGLPVIGVPKTIDFDLTTTEYTIGFHTAVHIATEALDRIVTTAKSHGRIFVVEVMGRYSGWIALYAGVAAGAHYIAIPEAPLNIDEIVKVIENRWKKGKRYAIIVVAEGVRIKGYYKEEVIDEFGNVKVGGVAEVLAKIIREKTGIETRHIVLGHLVRGGTPVALDRFISTQYGYLAVELVKKKMFGMMPAIVNGKLTAIPIEDGIRGLKKVNGNLYEFAKSFFV